MNEVKRIAEDLGFQYDKNGMSAVGEVQGYHILISKHNKGNLYYLTLSVKKGDKADKSDFNEIKNYNKYLRVPGLNKKNHRVVFTINGAFTMKGTIERFSELIHALVQFLHEKGFQNCSEESGVSHGVNVYFAAGLKIITKSEYLEIERRIQEKQEAIALRGTGSFFMGIIGALLGALLGGALVLVISRFGYIIWIGGVAMGALTMGGYKLLAGRIQKLGMLISAIIMLLVMYLVNRLDWALWIQSSLTPDMFGMEGTKLSLLYAYQHALSIVKIADLQGDYFLTLAQQLFFTFLFGLISAYAVMQWDKSSFLAYPVLEDKEDLQDLGLDNSEDNENQ